MLNARRSEQFAQTFRNVQNFCSNCKLFACFACVVVHSVSSVSVVLCCLLFCWCFHAQIVFGDLLRDTVLLLYSGLTAEIVPQINCNVFLVTPKTSPAFGTILVEYLLTRRNQMGPKCDRSTLYLKLFKLVFQSVTCSSQLGLTAGENELMLKVGVDG